MSATQVKKGYLRGVRGVLLTQLNADGSMPLVPEKWWVDTAQEVGIAAEVVAGESADLRGGDRLLLRIEEDDVIVGATLTFRDAKFDARASVYVGGGTLITEVVAAVKATATIGEGTDGTVTIERDTAGVAGNTYTVEVVEGVGNSVAMSAVLTSTDLVVTLGTDVSGDLDPAKNTATLVAAAIHAESGISATASGTGGTALPVAEPVKNFTGGADSYTEIIGWDSPTVEDQATKVPFQAEVYVQSHNDQGGREAYLVYTFRYCKGNAAEISHSNRSWGTPEFGIKARENPSTGLSAHKKEFKVALPTEAP